MTGNSLLPDSALCKAAFTYAKNVSDPWLYHHVMRSAIYADRLGRQRNMVFDRELLCVSAVLHDLGLTDEVPVQERFEIEGADAASRFLEEQGMAKEKLRTVWDAIALHTTVGIPLRKEPEVALCFLGIASDLGLIQPAQVTADFYDTVLELYPWLDTGAAITEALTKLFGKNPAAASSNAVSQACAHKLAGYREFNPFAHLAEVDRLRAGG